MNDFVPQKWATVIRATEDQLRPLSFGFVRGDVNGNLPTRTVETPRTPSGSLPAPRSSNSGRR